MPVVLDTIPDMAKKKPNGPGRPATGRKPTITIYARVRPELGEALEAYLASLRPRPTGTAVLEAALEDFLQGKGFWPPPQTKQP